MLARRIRSYRIKNHFTQKEVAVELGIKKSTVTAWEAGILHPTEKEIKQLSILFCVSPLILKGFDNYYSKVQIVPCNEKTKVPSLICILTAGALMMTGISILVSLLVISFSISNKNSSISSAIKGLFDYIISKVGVGYVWFGVIAILLGALLMIAHFLLKHISINGRKKR